MMSQTNENNKNCLTPKKALNKAYLKKKPLRNDIELFKKNLKNLLSKINEIEREENQKNHIRDFLRDTYYINTNEINTKDAIDLVIHLGTKASDNVGVIIEAKRPSNKSEMIAKDELNKKAMQELVLSYLRERITGKNLDIKNLVVTNINEWYIFDAVHFEKYFANNKELVRQFIDFQEGRLSGTDTSFFYNNIASKYIDEIKKDICFVYFNIKEYFEVLNNSSLQDDTALIALYKILSPEHLLKLPFENDSNSLNKNFYSELLHIIGLEEVKDGSKRLIQRKKDGNRNGGSLLESTIFQMDDDSNEERLFDNSLELVITWINRILFLKLLEAQQLKYQKDNQDYAFLNKNKISGFDELNNLFFKVLAVKPENRHQLVKEAFGYVPYLNSSLFEKSEIETKYFPISQLTDSKLQIYSATVLKDNAGKKSTGELPTLEYLFEFLNAYDFSSEGAEEVQENNKTLINASVLGLIFEKLNGYKDGSFFTPGFITMYMCKETIQKAVVQKFNEIKQWNCKDLADIYNKIEDRVEANSIINSLHICDPAVGSGHFLVSALNEILSVKSYLGIMLDKQGRRLKDYAIILENDEVILTDEDGSIFSYNPNSTESRRIQETLFNEKRTIIENCLFGVDINPNSVKICRLRLWIELLKSAFYTEESHFTQLETLPNIDINIKCGNSLISRFDTNIDIKPELKKLKYTVQQYKDAVLKYKNATSKAEKQELETLIQSIKNNFRSEVENNDKEFKEKKKLMIELDILSQGELFELSEKELAARNKRRDEIAERIRFIDILIEDIRSNKIFEHAFEWRFEFPEVLNDDGDFIGFDVVIGNPPWGAPIGDKELDHVKYKNNDIIVRMTDSFMFFVNLGISLVGHQGVLAQILPDVILYQIDNEKLRLKLSNNMKMLFAINLGDHIFTDVARPSAIIIFSKGVSNCTFVGECTDGTSRYISNDKLEKINDNLLKMLPNNIIPTKHLDGYSLLVKLAGSKLRDYLDSDGIQRGVSPDLKEAFIVNKKIIESENLEPSCLKPTFTGGRDVEPYFNTIIDSFVIYTSRDVNPSAIPNIVSYINKYSHKITCKEVKLGKHPIWALHRPREIKIFEKDEKLLGVITGDRINVAIDKYRTYPTDGLYLFCSNGRISNITLLGILNSKLITFLYRLLSMEENRTLAQVKPVLLEEIPFSFKNDKYLIDIESLTTSLIESIKHNTNYHELKKSIDKAVYSLFDLSSVEIEMIEKS